MVFLPPAVYTAVAVVYKSFFSLFYRESGAGR